MMLIAGYGIFHLLFASWIGLAGDEAYYWQWSNQLDWGYYDHPPMIAYLIWLGRHLAGPGELGVRLLPVLLTCATLWLVYRLATEFATCSPPLIRLTRPEPDTAGLWAVVILVATPLFGLGSFLATPDIPMVFFWTLAIGLTWRAVQEPTTGRWISVGLAVGLGLLSKYPLVILPIALLVAFAATHHGRRLLRTRGPWIAAGVALLVCVPHIVWQIEHQFVSVQFQIGHRLDASTGAGMKLQGLSSVAHFVAGQAGVISPLLFLLFLWAVGLAAAMLIRWQGKRNLHGAPAEILPWLVVVPAALTWMGFALASYFSKSQTNWPAAAYTTLSVILGLMMATWVSHRGARRVLAWIAIVPAMLVTGYAHYEAAIPTLPIRNSVFDKLQNQRGLARWLDTLRGQSAHHQTAVVLADNYRLASLLRFYLADQPYTDAPFEKGSGAQYVLWRTNGSRPSAGQAWYLTPFKDDHRMTRLFQSLRLEGEYVGTRAGVVTSTLYAYFGTLRQPPSVRLARKDNLITQFRTVLHRAAPTP